MPQSQDCSLIDTIYQHYSQYYLWDTWWIWKSQTL